MTKQEAIRKADAEWIKAANDRIKAAALPDDAGRRGPMKRNPPTGNPRPGTKSDRILKWFQARKGEWFSHLLLDQCMSNVCLYGTARSRDRRIQEFVVAKKLKVQRLKTHAMWSAK